MLSKAVEWDILKSHPLAKLKPFKTDNGIVRYLTSEEEERLRKALIARDNQIKLARCNGNVWRQERGYELYPNLGAQAFADHLHPIVILAINTGLRRGEIFQLKSSDVNFDSEILTVKAANSKSGKARHVPLNRQAYSVLYHWRQQQKNGNYLVFPSKNSLAFSHIKRSWASLLSSAEIENFRFHDLRHHFASKLVMAGVDLNTVRELLGHADIAMTLRYAHLAPEHKANAVKKLLQDFPIVSQNFNKNLENKIYRNSEQHSDN